jgi:hypothetical protein
MKKNQITRIQDSHEEYLSKTHYESASTIKLAIESDNDYVWFKKANKGNTKAQSFGTALHMALLEPEKFDNTYWCLSDSDKEDPSSSWVVKVNKDKKVALVELHAGKLLLEEDEWSAIQIVGERLIYDNRFTDFVAPAYKEVSFYDDNFFEGIAVKCRPDAYFGVMDVDIKSTKAADPKGFWYEFLKYKYHIQRAVAVDIMHKYGIPIEASCILAVSNTPPFNHEFYRVPDHLIESGRELYQLGLQNIKRIKAGEIYNGYQIPGQQMDENGMIILENKWK